MSSEAKFEAKSEMVRMRNAIQEEMYSLLRHLQPSAFQSNTRVHAQSRMDALVSEVSDLNRRIAQINTYKRKRTWS